MLASVPAVVADPLEPLITTMTPPEEFDPPARQIVAVGQVMAVVRPPHPSPRLLTPDGR
jgi:hypothetical protein